MLTLVIILLTIFVGLDNPALAICAAFAGDMMLVYFVFSHP